jgi:hypothetical protein
MGAFHSSMSLRDMAGVDGPGLNWIWSIPTLLDMTGGDFL